jgi:acetoin utilization protein AcuB
MKPDPMPKLLSYMTPFPYSVDANASVVVANELMQKYDIRHLPVQENGDIVGLLSERDLEHAVRFGESLAASELLVRDVCSSDVVVADSHDPLDKVLEAMAERRLGSIVVCHFGELAGIFTATDACRYFAVLLQQQYNAT